MIPDQIFTYWETGGKLNFQKQTLKLVQFEENEEVWLYGKGSLTYIFM